MSVDFVSQRRCHYRAGDRTIVTRYATESDAPYATAAAAYGKKKEYRGGHGVIARVAPPDDMLLVKTASNLERDTLCDIRFAYVFQHAHERLTCARHVHLLMCRADAAATDADADARTRAQPHVRFVYARANAGNLNEFVRRTIGDRAKADANKAAAASHASSEAAVASSRNNDDADAAAAVAADDYTCMPIDELRKLFWQMLCGVDALHSVGWTHGDIKPDNFLVNVTPDRKAYVTLADFGRAQPVTDATHHVSPMYHTHERAPELMLREDDEDGDGGRVDGATTARGSTRAHLMRPAADVWALGCAFFLLARGVTWCDAYAEKDAFRALYAGTDAQASIDREVRARLGAWKGEVYHHDRTENARTAKPVELAPVRASKHDVGAPEVFVLLLARMLAVRVEDRWTTRDLMQHAFFQMGNPPPKSLPPLALPPLLKLQHRSRDPPSTWPAELDTYTERALHCMPTLDAPLRPRVRAMTRLLHAGTEETRWFEHDGDTAAYRARCTHRANTTALQCRVELLAFAYARLQTRMGGYRRDLKFESSQSKSELHRALDELDVFIVHYLRGDI
jgi:hypothetical protein